MTKLNELMTTLQNLTELAKEVPSESFMAVHYVMKLLVEKMTKIKTTQVI